ncbi:hypothetical protein BDV93DRAFT_507399 [Ceratobasidium sp. AG-I]|nr:hypothetical protein BDV93DRAFT_507399 [Ceratobasidium sp. AG-I]
MSETLEGTPRWEIHIWSKVTGLSNVLKLMGIIRDNGVPLAMIAEFCDQGNLHSVNFVGSNYVYQALKGLCHVHSLGIIQGDMKPSSKMLTPLVTKENVVLTTGNRSTPTISLTAKLCDFGSAEDTSAPETKDSDYAGAELYRSPEMLIGDSIMPSFESDIWAFVDGEVVGVRPQSVRQLIISTGNSTISDSKGLAESRLEDRVSATCGNLMKHIATARLELHYGIVSGPYLWYNREFGNATGRTQRWLYPGGIVKAEGYISKSLSTTCVMWCATSPASPIPFHSNNTVHKPPNVPCSRHSTKRYVPLSSATSPQAGSKTIDVYSSRSGDKQRRSPNNKIEDVIRPAPRQSAHEAGDAIKKSSWRRLTHVQQVHQLCTSLLPVASQVSYATIVHKAFISRAHQTYNVKLHTLDTQRRHNTQLNLIDIPTLRPGQQFISPSSINVGSLPHDIIARTDNQIGQSRFRPVHLSSSLDLMSIPRNLRRCTSFASLLYSGFVSGTCQVYARVSSTPVYGY